MPKLNRILSIIVLAQFCCTSLWFASNAVINDIVLEFSLSENALGYLTSAIQFGFIVGTLTFAVFNISDRFSPSKVFFISAIFGAFFNLGILWSENTLISLMMLRFFTGFSLAGIYPVGMKIATDYFEKGLGKSLSFLVGALVLGTAFPHLLNQFSDNFSWDLVIEGTSALATIGGILILILVSDGPFRKKSKKIDFTSFFTIFKSQKFHSVAFGYFGHMWELYAFWTFVPLMIKYYSQQTNSNLNVSLLSFIIIGLGSIACVIGGYLSEKVTIKKTVLIALVSSGICCLFSPLVYHYLSTVWFLAFLAFWGMVVIMDSPLLSTLVAKNADPAKKGTALTIVNCIGYLITIISIQLISKVLDFIELEDAFLILVAGPFFSVIHLFKARYVN